MRKLAAVLAFAILSACGSDSATAPKATIAGTWSLQSINGAPLPYVVQQTGTDKLELVSDVLVISGTGSFTQTTTARVTTNGQATTQSVGDAGSYALNGTAVTFQFNSDGSSATASWSDNTLTVTETGVALVYKR